MDENKFTKIKSLNYNFENKFIYLIDEVHITIYCFNFYNTSFIKKIELEYPVIVIVSDDNNIIVLEKIYKINNPEISKAIEIIMEKINGFPN